MNRWRQRFNTAALLSMLSCAGLGCANAHYRYGMPNRPLTQRVPCESNPVTWGGEHPKLDRAEKWISYPSKKLKQWFPGDEPTVDPEEARRLAIVKAQEYLALNDLADVRIDVREYDPATQWRRLCGNDSIHPFWKYTGGSMSHLTYTLLPGRVFHTDTFNPYTNTLSLNSSNPSMALYAAAEAKVIFNRRYPGAYLAACRVPFVGISKNVSVANDVLSYVRTRREWELERDLTRHVYSDFGAELVFEALPLVPGSDGFPFYYGPLMSVAGSAAGDAAGQAVLKQRETDQEQEESVEKN